MGKTTLGGIDSLQLFSFLFDYGGDYKESCRRAVVKTKY